MRFKEFLEGWASDNSMPYQAAVDKGRAKEGEIMRAMQKNCNLNVRPASGGDDILKGIDCYITIQGRIYPTQIKARQSSEGALFVYEEEGRPGRDMKGQAELYAFVILGKLYLVRTVNVRKAITDVVALRKNPNQEKFMVDYKGVTCHVINTNDQRNGKRKVVVIIPIELFTDFFTPVIPPCDLAGRI